MYSAVCQYPQTVLQVLASSSTSQIQAKLPEHTNPSYHLDFYGPAMHRSVAQELASGIDRINDVNSDDYARFTSTIVYSAFVPSLPNGRLPEDRNGSITALDFGRRFVHVYLVIPCYRRLLISTILQLLSVQCFVCNKLRLPRRAAIDRWNSRAYPFNRLDAFSYQPFQSNKTIPQMIEELSENVTLSFFALKPYFYTGLFPFTSVIRTCVITSPLTYSTTPFYTLYLIQLLVGPYKAR